MTESQWLKLEDTSGSHVGQPACSASVCCTSFHVLDASRNRITNTQMLLKRPSSILETSRNGERMSHILFKWKSLPSPQCCALAPYFGVLRHKACAAAQGSRSKLGLDLAFSFVMWCLWYNCKIIPKSQNVTNSVFQLQLEYILILAE